jgi:hypothetical protein
MEKSLKRKCNKTPIGVVGEKGEKDVASMSKVPRVSPGIQTFFKPRYVSSYCISDEEVREVIIMDKDPAFLSQITDVDIDYLNGKTKELGRLIKLMRSEKVEEKLIQLGLQGKELVEDIMTLKEEVAKKSRIISTLKSTKDKATRSSYYWETRDELVELAKWQNIINIANGLISAVKKM